MNGYYVNVRTERSKGILSGPYGSQGEAAVAADSVRRYYGPLGQGAGKLGPFTEYGVARINASVLPVIRNGRKVAS